MRVEIVGNIASGKTTLAQALSPGMASSLENFQSNPFWKAFYEDSIGNAFETELTFTLQHYHQIKQRQSHIEPFVCDYSLLLDRAYARVMLSGKRQDIYNAMFDELVAEVGNADAVIHLSCSEDILLERIRERGRIVESTITIKYLASMTKEIEGVLALVESSSDIIKIRSDELDFAHSRTAVEKVRRLVEQSLFP